MSECIAREGIALRRLKTGTPSRLDPDSIDFDECDVQHGDDVPWPMSDRHLAETVPGRAADYFWGDPASKFVRNDCVCWITRTNVKTHDILRSGFKDSPMFSGRIHGKGPRYCPSIEDKINRFGDRDGHQLFLEPEQADIGRVYINGFSSSLPADIQLAAIHTIPGLTRARVLQIGYAVEYDSVDATQLYPTFECKKVPGLYFAGQVCGTSGYEEAAGQGLLAGINAALKIKGEGPFILGRSDSYLGVMADDLSNILLDEPYSAYGFGELGAELEDVTHFDAAGFREEFAAAGALADFGSFGNVRHFELREVAFRVAMLEVEAFFVRARHEVEGIGNGFVDDDAGVVCINRGSKARNHAAGLDEAVFGRVEFLGLQEVVELDFGNVEVARNNDRDELAFEVEEHTLGSGFGRDVQELSEIFDACAVRSFDLFESCIFIALERHTLEFGNFAVRLVAALLTKDQVVFAVRSVEHEFVSDFTAHDTRIALRSQMGWGDGDNGLDAYGFSACPAGYMYRTGRFYDMGHYAHFWSATEDGSDGAYSLYLNYGSEDATLMYDYKNSYYSVRCLNDDSNSGSSFAGWKTSWNYLNPDIYYGEMVDDRDGQIYKTVKIGDQVWMAENLNYESGGSSCGGGHDFQPGDCSKYGRLYIRFDAVGVCPEGWHLPDNTEWNALFAAVGGKEVAGKALRSQKGWVNDGNGPDVYGFSALAAGNRGSDGLYNYEDFNAYFWSASEDYSNNVNLFYNDVDEVLYVREDDRWKNY